MKKSPVFVIVVLLSIFITSCSLLEETVFNKDGSINYSFTLDSSSLMGMMPDSVSNGKDSPRFLRDTVISFADIIEELKDSIAALPPAEQEKFEAMKPFNIKSHFDQEKKEFFLQMFGKFDNVSALNKAISNLETVRKNLSKEKDKKLSLSPTESGYESLTHSLSKAQIKWDGKFLKKTIVPANYDSPEIDKDSLQTDIWLFSGGFKSVYKFPKKVKSVSGSTALLSQDGKTVIVNYDLQEYLTYPEKANIEIELEDE
ncbi:MAG: hypothetical protein LBT29_02970 [Flavobacteriaceae bacterium]|jgi:hypothetical protein|nr:hypothetical protein [Flavobacteriaceae bacterium]